jgi:hypothetical protein
MAGAARYRWPVVPVSFHDFFSGCATVAGALIGLLFVALSVSPEKLTGDDARAEHQVRAGAAFSALVNTLVIALVALLPGASLGQAGIIVAAAGLATTFGLVIVLYLEHQQKIRGDVSMLAILLALYALQLAAAVQLDGSPRSVSGISRLGALSIAFFLSGIASFLSGIARSWQLVGARDFSLASTVATVIHRPASEGTRPDASEQTPEAHPAASEDDDRGPSHA